MDDFFSTFFPFIFIGMWIFVSFLLSFLGGWYSLKNIYKKEITFNGEKWHFQSARIGLVSYNSCVTVGADRNNLFLGVFFLFKIGHPDLVIPFADIEGKETKMLFFKYVKLKFKKNYSTNIVISKRLADKIEAHSNWKYERSQEL